ncbi:MAG: tetratricopeptide repeat protein [Prevotellaceae bacterium]|jgi:tetratricopeptide (TPR) repeat protein|nr:tetratricopeptide repeat protein [Prevotellaceae bacterium]
MFENKNYIQQSEQLAKRYEKDKQHYFELDEFIAISDYYVLNNNYKNALEVNRTAEIFYPSSFEIKAIRADLYIRNNEFEKAEEVIKDIESNSDAIADVHILRGEICIKKNQYKSAEQLFDKAIKVSDDKESTLEIVCDFLMIMHQIRLAKKYLEIAQKTIPDISLNLVYWLAKCYEYDSEYRKAAKIYEKMTEIEPFDENVWDDLGDVYMLLSEYENAIKAFDLRLAASNVNATETLINKAECLSMLKKNNEAIKIYNKILDFEKENPDAMFGIAKCYEREEIYGIAERIYLDIVAQNPHYVDAYYSLATIYSQKNEFKMAEQFMRKTMNETEIVPVFLIQMSKILLQQNKINEARQTMENFIYNDSCKYDYHVWLLYAEIIAVDDIENAIDIIETKYNECFYSVAEVCYHLAYYHFINDDISQCIIYIERGLELNSDMIKSLFDLCPEIMLNEQIMSVYLSFKANK